MMETNSLTYTEAFNVKITGYVESCPVLMCILCFSIVAGYVLLSVVLCVFPQRNTQFRCSAVQ